MTQTDPVLKAERLTGEFEEMYLVLVVENETFKVYKQMEYPSHYLARKQAWIEAGIRNQPLDDGPIGEHHPYLIAFWHELYPNDEFTILFSERPTRTRWKVTPDDHPNEAS